MQMKVVAIESGGQYPDKRRRVVLEVVRAAGSGDFGYDRLRLSERELGLVGLKLDDPIDIGFAVVAADVRAARGQVRLCDHPWHALKAAYGPIACPGCGSGIWEKRNEWGTGPLFTGNKEPQEPRR
jgi:hypothetical protein